MYTWAGICLVFGIIILSAIAIKVMGPDAFVVSAFMILDVILLAIAFRYGPPTGF